MVEGAKETGSDRIELYTESYAQDFLVDKERAIKPFIESALVANDLDLGINAGHDLSLVNIQYFKNSIPQLLEVSIGHALISEALYFGFESVIKDYLKKLAS
jgi:pyridoxine 5-phosphate synthase